MKNAGWQEDELGVILWGMASLFVIIIGGMFMAGNALNELTRQSEYLHFLNIQVHRLGEYTFYYLGNNLQLSGLCEIGTIKSAGRKLGLSIGGHNISLNTMPAFDFQAVFRILGLWIQVIKQGAFMLLCDSVRWLIDAGGILKEHLKVLYQHY